MESLAQFSYISSSQYSKLYAYFDAGAADKVGTESLLGIVSRPLFALIFLLALLPFILIRFVFSSSKSLSITISSDSMASGAPSSKSQNLRFLSSKALDGASYLLSKGGEKLGKVEGLERVGEGMRSVGDRVDKFRDGTLGVAGGSVHSQVSPPSPTFASSSRSGSPMPPPSVSQPPPRSISLKSFSSYFSPPASSSGTSTPTLVSSYNPFSTASRTARALAAQKAEKEWFDLSGWGRGTGEEDGEVVCFPGFAKILPSEDGEFEAPMKLEVVVKGFVMKIKQLNELSRTQRVILSVVKGHTSLPPLPDTEGTENLGASKSEEDLLKKAAEGGDAEERAYSLLEKAEDGNGEKDAEEVLLEQDLRTVAAEQYEATEVPMRELDQSSSVPSTLIDEPTPISPPLPPAKSASAPALSSTTKNPFVWATPTAENLPVYHQNVTARLVPFFAKKLEGREIKVSIYPVYSNPSHEGDIRRGVVGEKPLLVENLKTGTSGGWSDRVKIALGREWLEGKEKLLGVEVRGELWEEELPTSVPGNPVPVAEGSIPSPEEKKEKKLVGLKGTVRYPVVTSLCSLSAGGDLKSEEEHIVVISDIDDTIKHSHVLGGVRSVLRNAGALPLEEVIVPGIPDWYTAMEKEGVNFAYVSNGPWEMWRVIEQFMKVNNLPVGGVTLKEYGKGSSILSKMWEDPATRKRPGFEGTMSEYPNSKFLLIGDSGEHDLELYTSLAQLHPDKIIAILIRDVTTPHILLSSPPKQGDAQAVETDKPLPQRPSSPALSESSSTHSLSLPSDVDPSSLTEVQKKALLAWHTRVAKAESQIPKGIPFKIWNRGEDVKEWTLELVKKMKNGDEN